MLPLGCFIGKMKRLGIPYLPALDVLDISSAGLLMEHKAHRGYIDVINWKDYLYKPIAAFDVARSKVELYIRYFVRGYSLRAVYEADGSPVERDSCVECYIQKPEGTSYMAFAFNCIGACAGAEHYARDIKTPLSAAHYARIRRYSTTEPRTFDEKKGIYSWEVVVAIPLRLLSLTPECLPKKILGNFSKRADATAYPHYISWNPIDTPSPDFHCPEFFGELYFCA